MNFFCVDQNRLNHGRVKKIAMILAYLWLVSCSGQVRSSGSSDQGFDILKALEERLERAPTAAEIASLRNVSILEHYQFLLDHASDEPIVVRGHLLGGAKTLLRNASPIFAMLQARFGSVGQVLESSRQQSSNSAQLEAEFKNLAATYNAKDGIIKDLQGSTKTRHLAPASPEIAKFNFTVFAAIKAGLKNISVKGLKLQSELNLAGSDANDGSDGNCQSAGKMYLIHVKTGPLEYRLGHAATFFEGNSAAGFLNIYQDYPDTGVRITTLPKEHYTNSYGYREGKFSGKYVNPKNVEVVYVGDLSPDEYQKFVDKMFSKDDDFSTQRVEGTNYNLLMNNCAKHSLHTLRDAGFPIDYNFPVVTPSGLAGSVKKFVSDNNTPASE